MIPGDQTSAPSNRSGQQQWGSGFNLGQKFDQFGNWLGDVLGTNPVASRPEYQFDWSNYGQDRGNQMALLAQLQQMAAGNGPSLAQGQLQQATDANISNAMALGAAQQGQGLGYASALRNIADQSAAARQQAAGQSSLLRNMEQMQAMQQQMGLLGQMQGANLQQQGMGASNAFNYAGLNANIDLQNQAAKRQVAGYAINSLGGALANAQKGAGLATGNPAALTGMAHGGMVPYTRGTYPEAASSEWESPRAEAKEHGAMAKGGAVDSEANDTVPAMLSPGEIVIPRSITMAPDAAERSKAFVEAIMERRRARPRSDVHHLHREVMRSKSAREKK